MPGSAADGRARTIRRATVVVVWLCGLAAGFVAVLAIAARYGCGDGDRGLACRGGGSALGVLLILLVIGIVTVVTVASLGREPRAVLLLGAAGSIGLILCFLAARGLLGTI